MATASQLGQRTCCASSGAPNKCDAGNLARLGRTTVSSLSASRDIVTPAALPSSVPDGRAKSRTLALAFEPGHSFGTRQTTIGNGDPVIPAFAEMSGDWLIGGAKPEFIPL